MPIDFDRERAWWDAKAPQEERDREDEAVNRALRWREIERHLDGAHTVLDVGGGGGAFSVPLARRGLAVTHLDLSAAMLALARHKVDGSHSVRGLRNARGGLSNAPLAPGFGHPGGMDRDVLGVSFVQGNAVALPFPDRAFDLVLNTDGAVSFCGPLAEQAIRETCRVARKILILSVSHRARLIPVWVTGSVHVTGRIVPAVEAMFDHGEWHQDQFPDNASLARGMTQDYMGALKGFLPHELRVVLEGQGLRVLRCGGLGSLANLCGQETLAKVVQDGALFEEFLDLCERFDREVLPGGPGTRQRAGLMAVAVKGGPSSGLVHGQGEG